MRRSLLAGLATAAVLLLRCPVQADSPASVSAVVPIADQLSVRATNIATSEGASISGPIATFTDSDAARPSSAFSATVIWGDGTSSAGTVAGASGSFSVTASHVYAEEGSYPIRVSVQQAPNGSRAGARGTATISDAALSAVGTHVSSGVDLHAVVATFTDADPGHLVTDYTALIKWGDGSHSAGKVSAQGGGFAVTGAHQYGHPGSYTITIAIADTGGARASATTSASIRRG
jgi:hypothetical protein